MKVSKKYVVYQLVPLLGTDNLTFKKVKFNNSLGNSFDSKKEAIQALIDDGKLYQDYTIMNQTYITNYKED